MKLLNQMSIMELEHLYRNMRRSGKIYLIIDGDFITQNMIKQLIMEAL